MSKFHINKHGVPAPCRATKGNCPLGGEGEHFNTQQEAQEYADKVNMEKHGYLPSIEAASNDIEISKEHADSMFPDAHFNNGYFSSGPHKGEIDEGVRDGDEASIALKNAMPKEIFENNETFTLVPEKNAEAFYQNTIMVPFSDDAPESQYENMVATVKANSPNSVSDENGWDEIDQDLSDKISSFAAEKSLKESNLTINGSKVIVADYKERNWAEEYFKSKEYDKTITHTTDPKKFAEVFPDVYDESGFTQSGATIYEIQESTHTSRENVEEVLPKEISDKVFNEKNKYISMIKEDDVAEHINRWALRGQPSDYEEDEFYKFRENETIPYLRENFPNEVVEVNSLTLGKGYAPSDELSGKISNFAKETLDKENKNRVKINGQRIYFDDSFSNTKTTELGDYTQNMLLRNWPKEYKESLDN